MPEHELLIRAGRAFCPVTGLDGPGAVAVRGGRIVASGPDTTGQARQFLDFPGSLLLPGLVDLHAHPGLEDSKYGIDPDKHLLPRGTTTVMSQGDAGALNWDRYQRDIVQGSTTRVLMALNLAAAGESRPSGCLEDLDNADVDACVRAVEKQQSGIWGISLNTSLLCCGDTNPDDVWERGLAVADRTGLPFLFGTRREPDRSLDAQLAALRPGDVVTYCFHGRSEGLLKDGHVRDSVWAARERGVLFDVGHGIASFSFEVAETAIADGFYPDSLSSDFYQRHLGLEPIHDMPRTLSKLVAVGMPEEEAFARATARPAEILRLQDEAGSLCPGSCADLTVLNWNPDPAVLCDSLGVERPGGCWESVLTVRTGRVVFREDQL
jgi:dihydroorotase